MYTVHFWLSTDKVKGVQPGPKGSSVYVEIASLIEYLGKDAAEVCGLISDVDPVAELASKMGEEDTG